MKGLIIKFKNNQILHNSGWLIWGKVVQLVISFFVSILTARYLGPSNYGILNLAMAYTAFAIPFCTLGISNIIVKEFIDCPSKEGELLGSGIGIRIIVSFSAIIVLLMLVYLINPQNEKLLIVSCVYSLVLIFKSFDLFEYWFQSKLISKVSANIGIIAYIIISIFRVILLLLHCDVVWFGVAYVLDVALIMAMYLLFYHKKGESKLRFSWDTTKNLLSKSYHYILASMMVVVYAQIDKIMIGKMEDSNAVGLYATALTICGLWTFVIQAIIDSARPVIIQTKYADEKKYQKKLTQLYSIVIWISILVSSFFCIFAGLIVNVLYGESYIGAVMPLRIITWYTCFSYLGVARNIWSVCEEKQKYEKYFAATGAIGNTILNLLLIPILGINGAALASLLTQLITNLVMPFVIKETRENAIYVIKAFNIKNIFDIVKNI